MKKYAKNLFNEGMLLDVHPSVQKQSTSRKTKNFRVITRDNNSFILTNLKGTELKGALPANYVPLAIEDKNGVAYIISGEVIAGVATGKGEIGCFPSPDYATGNITYVYRPLMNYAGDDGAFALKNGPFRSTHFNFDLENIIDIELQNDYDGSINIVFTDGKSPIRIVNSGFSVIPSSKYELIDRIGTKDTNKYSAVNFENVINLIARSTKILKVVFEGSVAGGTLPYGNYQYYFMYATSDGNETEIVAQSFSVPVFAGDKVGNISGGKITGEASNKMNRFTLSNLDESYAFVAVLVVHGDGMNSLVKSAYRLTQKYPINGSSMEFVHTGYEDKNTIPLTDLIGESISIDTATTLAQVQGYLFAGNVKEKGYNVTALRKFVRMIKLGHKEILLDMIGPENNFSRLFDEAINQTELKAGTSGYNGGYVNPKNVHDKMGYWGGEAYPFVARLIFPDGFMSPAFPCVGIDNVNNTETGTVDGATEATINGLDVTGGFSTDGKILNSQGIYRFPNRNVAGVGKLFSRDVSTSEGRITVNGITFKIPALNTDLGDGKTIKDYAIGIQFFRGERKADALIQGLMMDTQYVPMIRFDDANTDQKLWNYLSGSGGYTGDNGKLIPAFAHILESIHIWGEVGGERTNQEDNGDNRHGIVPFKFNLLNRDPHVRFTTNKSPFALISSDLIVNPTKYAGISTKNITARLLYRFTHEARVMTARVLQEPGVGDHFSGLIPISSTNMSGSDVYSGQAGYTPENSEVKNSIGFASAAYFQTKEGDGMSKYLLFRLYYNAYLGIRLNTTLRASNTSTTGESGEKVYGLLGSTFPASFLANIYEGASQRSADAIRQVYQNTDAIRYFPISERMYWDDTVVDADPTNTLEGKLDGSRKITLFNGDCFINFTLRKVFNNAELSDPAIADKNTRVRTGYTIGIVNEGNENASFRSLETLDLVEGERKHPLAYINKFSAVGDNYGRNNLWREYYKTESAGYNKGYGMISGNVSSVSLPKDAPYIQSHWRTRVWHTAQHIANSFENGYRRFFTAGYKDYPVKHGQIIKLISNNDQLYCIQETAVGVIPINERIQTGSGSGEPVYLEATSVLAPKMRMISEEIGSQHKRSIASTDNGVFGVSLKRSIIWFAPNGGNALVRISDLAIRSYLDDNYGGVPLQKVEHLQHNIVATWNKKFDEVVFTFYKKESGSLENDRTFTVQFNEVSKKMHSFYSFMAMQYFRVNDDLYSFNVKALNGSIWLHDTLNPAIEMNTFYGITQESSIAFAVNQDDGFKQYDNIHIGSNFNKPDRIKYMVDGALSEHDLVRIVNDKLNSNCDYERGVWSIAIPKITLVHNQDAEQKVPDVMAGNSSSMALRSRVKGKFMIVEIVYNTGDLIELKEVNTNYILSR